MKQKGLILLISVVAIVASCKQTDTNRTSIIGTWNCEAYSNNGQQHYQVSIVRNYHLPESSNEYIINNFNNSGISEDNEVYIQDKGNGKLIITGTASSKVNYSGNGNVASDFSSIEWTYQVANGIDNPTVNAHYY